jgi:hypothetical protein
LHERCACNAGNYPCKAPLKGKSMHLKVKIGPIFGLRRCFLNNPEKWLKNRG